MSEANRLEVRAGLQSSLARLWRYALVSSNARDAADDLVQATCLRAIERADQFIPGTRMTGGCSQFFARSGLTRYDRNEFVEAAVSSTRRGAPISDGVREMETNITASTVLRATSRLPEAQRETILLVYVDGYSYAGAATDLGESIGTIMSRLAAGRAVLAKLK